MRLKFIKVTFIRLLIIVILLISLQIAFLEILSIYRGVSKPNILLQSEDLYDPSLHRLNNLSKLAVYCDSLYGSSDIRDSARYARIAGTVLRKRFLHAFAFYGPGYNTIGWVLAPLIHEHLSAIVLPNDILKYACGGCSQQAIVGMELFRLKGYSVRKAAFYDSLKNVGHFCFEVKYGGKWHFFDPDKEPNLDLMDIHQRPSIAELVANKSLLDSLYARNGGTDSNTYLQHFATGPENTFPAKNARIYQVTTKFLSMTLPIWLFIGFWFVRSQRKKSLSKL